ncbi:hypothetical protein ACFOGI_06635 [Virgibacillus xinjiangensis]|uniref:Uncharacterized protein n=1 Tax=Virgibacillus xinjiangensis TaxID=393090 RepID=A0ABV7CUU0_9BACI
MRKWLLIFPGLTLIFIGWLYFPFLEEERDLQEERYIKKESGEFVLHVKIGRKEDKIEVLRSLQYLGKESIEIEHRTPLASVSFGHRNHDFTGSPVHRRLNSGDIYLPKTDAIFSLNEENACKVYIHAEFTADGEEVVIDHAEELPFH